MNIRLQWMFLNPFFSQTKPIEAGNFVVLIQLYMSVEPDYLGVIFTVVGFINKKKVKQLQLAKDTHRL